MCVCCSCHEPGGAHSTGCVCGGGHRHSHQNHPLQSGRGEVCRSPQEKRESLRNCEAHFFFNFGSKSDCFYSSSHTLCKSYKANIILHTQLFASIMRQEIGFFDNSRTGELTNRLGSDTQVVQNAVTTNISMLARYTLQMILSIALMFYISPRLTAVLLSVVPVIAVSAVQYGEQI